MERLIKSLFTVMGSSSAMRTAPPDQLLGTVLEEVLKAVDDAVLGWICLARGLPDHLNWPAAVTALPPDSIYLAAVRYAGKETPTAPTLACPGCPCSRFLTGADPPPQYSVIEHCPHPALTGPPVGTHACVPLFAQDRPIGVLNLAKAASASFSTIEWLFLQTVASQLSAALENAGLIGETQARLKETQILLTERKQLEQQLVQTERLRALGEMASGVAHNFNNVLGAILGRAQLLRRTVLEPEAQRGLEAIEKAALDGANMVRRLQQFTRQRRDDEEFFPIDLNQVAKDVLTITEAKWKDEANLAGTIITIATSYGKTAPVMGNVSELREVLTNLIFNAVEAMPNGGILTVKTEEGEGWVCVSVSDTGIGMTDDVKARMFDPFFTTKGIKGTGLGLDVSYGIVRGHHGEINVHSQPGQGTTVSIKLPIPSNLAIAQRKPTPSVKTGRLLVIDDDDMIRELLSELLRMAGHTVVLAKGGREGIRLFQQGSFDLVLTDLGMPECTGWEVASAVKSMAPRTPVALITGWALTLDRGKLKEAGVDVVLNKPFQVADVMTVVAEGLGLREKT